MNLCNSFSILLLLLVFCNPIQCQFSFGIEAGYTNAYQEYGDVELPVDAEIDVNGMNASLIVTYDLSNNLALEFSPGYIERGAACKPGFIGFAGDSDLLLKYIQLPAVLKYRVAFLNGIISPNINIGYGLAYNFNALERTQLNNGEDNERFILNDISNANRIFKLDHGLYSGIGLEIKHGLNVFSISLRNFRSIRNSEKENTSLNRSNSFNLGLRQYL